MRLIDLDEVRDDFANIVYAECSDDNDNNRANRIIDAFDDLPIIEAEPVSIGQWIIKDDIYFVCSECGELSDYECDGTHKRSLYCPNCGAKMDLNSES